MKFQERAVFFSAVSKKHCDFHSRLDFKAVKLTFGLVMRLICALKIGNCQYICVVFFLSLNPV